MKIPIKVFPFENKMIFLLRNNAFWCLFSRKGYFLQGHLKIALYVNDSSLSFFCLMSETFLLSKITVYKQTACFSTTMAMLFPSKNVNRTRYFQFHNLLIIPDLITGPFFRCIYFLEISLLK